MNEDQQAPETGGSWPLNVRCWFKHTLEHSRELYSATKPFEFDTIYQTIAIPNLGSINRNGRRFTHEIAEKMCESDCSTMFGKIETNGDNVEVLCDISHRIHNAFISGDDLWVEYSIIRTDNGKFMLDVFNSLPNQRYVLRPRGAGSIREDGTVSDDFKILSYDFVSTESDSFKPYQEWEVLQLGLTVFNNSELLHAWLDRPNADLGDKTPRELISSGKGGDVMLELGRIQHGIY